MTSQPSPGLGSFEALVENLQGITEALAATTTQRDVIEIVLTPAVQALGATAGIVLLVDETDQQMTIAGSQGYEDGVPTLWQEGPIAHHVLIADILRMKEARYFEDAGELKEAYPDLEGRTGGLLPVANATLPMFLDNQPLGVIVLDFTEPHPFIRAERRFLTILSGQCAVALGRAEAIRTLEARVEERTRQLEEEQRARAEEARVASEDRYRKLFDSIDEGFATVEVLFDEDGRAVDYRFLEVNLSHEKMTGIPRTVVGQRVRELMPTFEQSGIDRVARVALTGEPVRYEEHVSALGRWFDVYSTRVGGKDSRVVASVLNDITQRKRVEEELRVSEERFRLFVTASSDTVYRMSADWSDMQSLVGRGFLSDTHGSSLTWLEEYIPAGEKAFVRAAIDEAIRGRTVFELEHRVIRADGTIGWTLSRAVPLLNERGEIVEWFGAATDVTGRKHWEVRQAFLLKLADALGPLADPVAIQDTVTRETMEAFGADRCYYCEILGDTAVIRRDAARGTLPSVAGTYPLSSFALFKAAVEAGRPLIVHDVHTSDLVDDELRHLCLDLQAISFIDIPVMKGGQAVGMLCLVQSSPRQWTDLEVDLAAETAERTWATVERGRTEEALRESELRRGLAIDAAGLGTYVWHVQEDRSETDVRLLELLGVRDAAEVSLAMAMANVIHPDDRERYAAEATRALDPDGDGRFAIEARIVPPGGAARWMALTGQTVFEGEPRQAVRMYGTGADITERKQAENAVQASREQLRAVANLVPDLLWESEPDGETIWYNERWLEYTGQRFEQAIGWGWLDAIHPEDRDASARRYQESVTAGQPLRQEHRIRRHDGEYRWFTVNTAPVLGERGQVIRMYGSATDIHDLRALNTELEVRVEDRTQRLRDLNGELRTLATASSEEINEPLRRLRGFLHLLEGRIAPHLDEKTRRYFDLVQVEAERAERMAEDFKALSSLEHRELKPTLVPLVTLVLQVRTDLAPRLIGQTAEWTVGSLPVVTGDAMLLRQAFTELLHHNLRLVPEGIKAQVEVNPTAVDERGAILVDVWPVRATAADLQGDGLATARRVMQRHGGTLEAELQGEHFRILLKLPDRRSQSAGMWVSR